MTLLTNIGYQGGQILPNSNAFVSCLESKFTLNWVHAESGKGERVEYIYVRHLGWQRAVKRAWEVRQQGRRCILILEHGEHVPVIPNQPVVIPVKRLDQRDLLFWTIELGTSVSRVIVEKSRQLQLILDADCAQIDDLALSASDPYGHWPTADAHGGSMSLD